MTRKIPSSTRCFDATARSSVVKALTTEQVIADLARTYEAGRALAALEIETGIPHGSIQRTLKNAGGGDEASRVPEDQSRMGNAEPS